jgi:hypothetical protein
MAKGSAVWLPSPDPPAPKTWEYEPSTVAEIGQIPETPPGVPTGFGLAASGGMLPKLASGQRGSGGRAVQLALTLVARRSQEVQARRHALPDSIRGGAGAI